MKIRILFYHYLERYTSEEFFEASENTSIQELFQNFGYEDRVDLSEYYPLGRDFCWCKNYLPYLFIDGKVSYDVRFCDSKVTDFLTTHNVADNTIRVTVDLPWAGAVDTSELVAFWNAIYPTLEQVAVICSLTGFNLGSLFSFLRNHFIKEKQPPQTCFDIIFSRNQWNSSELSELLDIEQEKAKEVLKLLDYQYDKTKMQFIQGEHTKEIYEKLLNVK